MITLATEPTANRIHFDKDTMWVDLTDGRRLGVPQPIFLVCCEQNPNNEKTMSSVVVGLGFTGRI